MTEHDPLEQVSAEEGELYGYRVVYERAPTGWSAYTPDLPGLGGAAATHEEMEQLMREAIPLHLEALREDREERPWLYSPESPAP